MGVQQRTYQDTRLVLGQTSSAIHLYTSRFEVFLPGKQRNGHTMVDVPLVQLIGKIFLELLDV